MKRHILVDTLGFILALNVTPAAVQDRDGGSLLLAVLTTAFGWLKRIWADGGYSGPLESEVANLKRHRQIELEIAKRSDKGFKILPKRWIVKRTFGWLAQSRRLIRDHEVKIEHYQALAYPPMTKRMPARIAAWTIFRQPPIKTVSPVRARRRRPACCNPAQNRCLCA